MKVSKGGPGGQPLSQCCKSVKILKFKVKKIALPRELIILNELGKLTYLPQKETSWELKTEFSRNKAFLLIKEAEPEGLLNSSPDS